MKKTLSLALAGLGGVYLLALIVKIIAGHGTVMMEANKAEPMDHWNFVVILVWCLTSIWAGYYLFMTTED